jgi:hypothetical protein
VIEIAKETIITIGSKMEKRDKVFLFILKLYRGYAIKNTIEV